MSAYVNEHYDELEERMQWQQASDVIREVEEQLGFSASSIRRAYDRQRAKRRQPNPKVHGNRKLTIFDESLLLGYLLMRSEASFAEKYEGIVEFSTYLDSGPISGSTARRIVERNESLLRPSRNKRMASARTDPITIQHTETFLGVWEHIIDVYDPPADHIVNADESILRASKDGTSITRLESNQKNGGSDFLCGKESVGSITPFVSASGTVWFVVFCLKVPVKDRGASDGTFSMYVPIEQRAKRSENTPHGFLICGTHSGLLNSYWWDQAVQRFIDIVRCSSLYPEKEIFLVTDNLGIHRQPASIKKAMQKQCYQVYFPPNCSHFIQPLDNLLFAGLKQTVRRFCSQIFDASLFWERKRNDLRELILEAVMATFPTIFSQHNIREAWSEVGIFPIRVDKVLVRAQENVGPIIDSSPQFNRNVDIEVAKKAKEAFEGLNQQHCERMATLRHTRRVTISNTYATSGTTGFLILDADTERKRREDERQRALDDKRQQAEQAKVRKQEEANRKAEEKRRREEELARQKEAATEERKKAKEAVTCRFNLCTRKWKGKTKFDDQWLWCSSCDIFGICWGHVKERNAMLLLQRHEWRCKRSSKK